MNPINQNESGCDPISSKCVIWQGPEIPCIDLCKGDSVTEVVYKLATRLCEVLDILDIDAYDLTCFDLKECGPKDFKGLIQLLIDKICELNDIDPSGGDSGGDPLQTEVSINEVFYYTNPQGDTVTTMTILNYVLAIGNYIGDLVSQIATINAMIEQLNIRITALENAPAPELELPMITPQCVLTSVPQSMDDVVVALEAQFCSLQTATGNPTQIVSAMASMCAGLSSSSQLSGSGQMKDLPGWFGAPSNLAQSLSNLWKTVCDMRNAISFIKNNCCEGGCDGIVFGAAGSLTDSSTLVLNFVSAVLPVNFTDAAAGSTIIIQDSAGGGPQTINSVDLAQDYIVPGNTYTIPLDAAINGTLDLSVTIIHRFYDPVTGTTCQGEFTFTVVGTESCPNLNITPGYTDVSFTFPWTGVTPATLTAQLYDSTGTTQLAVQSINIAGGAGSGSGSFAGLAEGTDYKVRLVIGGTPCDFENFTTQEYPCTAPLLVDAGITYGSDDLQGSTTGNTIAGWQVEYDAAHPV